MLVWHHCLRYVQSLWQPREAEAFVHQHLQPPLEVLPYICKSEEVQPYRHGLLSAGRSMDTFVPSRCEVVSTSEGSLPSLGRLNFRTRQPI